MKTKVEASGNRTYIEEMLHDKVPLRIIEARLKDIYGEEISRTALGRHRDKYVTGSTETKKSGTENKEACQDKDVTKVIEEPLSEIDTLKRRVRALELVAWEAASTVQYTGWSSYSITGKTLHQLTYKNIVEECMEDTQDLEGEYKAFLAGIVARRKLADGEPLKDVFVEQRANLAAKNAEEAKIAAADQEIASGKASKQAAEDKITNLSAENVRQMKQAKADIKAREAKHAADLKAIEEQAAIMEEQRIIIEEEIVE